MDGSNLSPKAAVDTIAFVDLQAQQARVRAAIDKAIADVLDNGAYIMGPQVAELEKDLSTFCGAKFSIGCSSGTDALLIALMAMGIGRGDAVICPAFTYTATPETIALLGATGVFTDVREDTFNLDPAKLDGAMAAAKARGLVPKAILPVDLFGLPADYDAILPYADMHGLSVLCDAAQGFGAAVGKKNVGQFGHVTATSFFPAKPLGCYGDGGAIFTDDSHLANVMRSILLHGKGADKYDAVRVGINGRLDTIQAAILIEKLTIFADEIEKRNVISEKYTAALAGKVCTPSVPNGHRSVWAQYTIRVAANRRTAIAKMLAAKGVPTNIYYPRPLHYQPAYQSHLVADGGASVSERLSQEVLSLPMHPYLSDAHQDRVVSALFDALSS
jgi:dTDP-4-amino-4,6-dideoxygalactose transaminase